VYNHSKQVYESSIYQHQEGESVFNIGVRCPIEVVHYPTKEITKKKIDIKLENDFNFLSVAQWGPRKNMKNTIRWFLEEFKDEEVGLIVKTNIAKNCLLDKRLCENKLKGQMAKVPDAKCKIYLLHGRMSDEEMSSLYQHPKIKCMLSLSHGEGFGLPLFEAAYHGMPVVAPDWSGQCDFLHMPAKDKKGKYKNKAMFARVGYNMQPVQDGAVWEGVIEKNSMWCHAEQGSYKMRIREIYDDYGRFNKQAKTLQKWINENFTKEKQYDLMVEKILNATDWADDTEVDDMFQQLLASG
jgi:hypothetical protein